MKSKISVCFMKIIGIDFGTKRIGVAFYNSVVDVVLPMGVVDSVEGVIDLVKKENADKIVLGLPMSLDNNLENKNIKRVKKFAEELSAKTEKEIEFYDERFSSQLADRMGEGVSRDEKSAMIILGDYLKNNKSAKNI